jgi:hypothetical protein
VAASVSEWTSPLAHAPGYNQPETETSCAWSYGFAATKVSLAPGTGVAFAVVPAGFTAR